MNFLKENMKFLENSLYFDINSHTYVRKCAVAEESKGYYSADKRMDHSVA